MSFWKPKFKLSGKVFTILRKRPDTDREETSRLKANSLVVRDYSDIPRTLSGPLPLGSTPGSTPTPRHDDPQPGSSNLGTSSADDSADVHQRYELVASCSW